MGESRGTMERLLQEKIKHSLNGGRGANFNYNKEKFDDEQGFGSSDEEAYTKELYPAEFNVKIKVKNQEEALKLFQEKYKDAKVEYAIAVDSNGYVSLHNKGGKSSVGVDLVNKTKGGKLIIHNHPNGSNFSKADLSFVTFQKESSGIVAVGKEYTYIFKKTGRFNIEGFSKAFNKASWSKKLSYDEGAYQWLMNNAKKYGYTYERVKTK